MNAGFLEAFIRLGYLNQDGKPRDPAPDPAPEPAPDPAPEPR
jgi:hypothetical protein